MKNQSALFSGEPDFARKIEGAVEKTLPYVHSYIVNTKSEADFESLKNDPNIALVEKEVLHPFPALIHSELQDASQAPVVTVVNPGRPWGIDAIKAPLVWQKTQQGKGSRVLLLDSGIDKAHPALKDNFEAGRDFTTDNPQDFSDFKGHGTHVAGTIAGAVLPSGFSGVAPKAKILMARVCVENAGCMSSAILGALNWAISKKVDVINISIASINMTDAEKLAITKVDKAGISVVAATGNWGTERIFFPAILPTVVAVGAVDEQLQHASFSQYGPQLAVVAPGVNILSSVRQGTAHDPTVTLAWDNQSVKLTASSFGGTKDVTEPLSLRIIDCGMGAASDYVGKGVEGKFALVQRGGPKFIEKLEVAIKAKVAGVIFMNNEPGLLYGRVTDPGVTSV
ncbi:MAG: S8 family serine peptidase, partial [Bdellovibrio sp.]|nr:S8 family serine peptidase [Bdellovibrio sp.]